MPRNLPKKEYQAAVVKDRKKRVAKTKKVKESLMVEGHYVTDIQYYTLLQYCLGYKKESILFTLISREFPEHEYELRTISAWTRTLWFQTLVAKHNEVSQQKFINDMQLEDDTTLAAFKGVMEGDEKYRYSSMAVMKGVELRMLATDSPMIKKGNFVNFNQQINNIITDAKTMRETWTPEQISHYAATGDQPKIVNKEE